MPGALILVRHGQTDWNLQLRFSGQTDIPLNETGREQARLAGKALLVTGVKIDEAFTSPLSRACDTLEIILEVLQQAPTVSITPELLERNYGVFEGRSKTEALEKYGPVLVQQVRRSWDHPVEGGETLKSVYGRVVPYYIAEISPLLMAGKTVMVSSHNNLIRALVKYLEHISDEAIEQFELVNGQVLMYTVSDSGEVTNAVHLNTESVT